MSTQLTHATCGRGWRPAGTARRAVPPAAILAVAVLAAAAGLGGAGSPDPAEAKKPKRPNVVVVETDDQTAASLAVMDEVNSRLGRYGATFENSFVNYALCCPSRATLLTGQYAHNHGTMGNGPPAGGFDKFNADHGGNTLPGWLQASGYYTAQVGKYLNGYGSGGNEAFVPAGWSEWRGATAGTTQQVYGYVMNENGTLVSYGQDAADFKQDVITAKAVDVINRRAPTKQPFFLDVNYTAPHSGRPDPNPNPPDNCANTAKPAPRHASAFDGAPLAQPASFNEADVSDKPPDISRMDPITNAERAEIARRYRCRIESLLSVDEGVARIVDALRATKELADTLVVFTSDNGFFTGEHRVQNGKVRHYEPSTRVPLVIRGPGIPEHKNVRELVVNADLASTILDAAHADPGLAQDGRSLLAVAERPNRERGREILLESQTFVGIRNARYKYVEHTGGVNAGAVELYDLEQDPGELQNQVSNPAYAAVRAQLDARLEALRSCSGESCRTKPNLKLTLKKRHGCVKRGARAKIKGADSKRLLGVSFEVDGKGDGGDGNAPFSDKLGKLHGKRAKVVATADLIDGRRVTLDEKVKVCR